jgi:hypothetical protein
MGIMEKEMDGAGSRGTTPVVECSGYDVGAFASWYVAVEVWAGRRWKEDMIEQISLAMSTSREQVERCISECLACHIACLRTTMQPGLELGGKHTEARHFRLMLDCAQICQTTADFLLRGSAVCDVLCGTCALVREACACSCEETGDLDECLLAARRCAESCRALMT